MDAKNDGWETMKKLYAMSVILFLLAALAPAPMPAWASTTADAIDEREPLTIVSEATGHILKSLDERRDEFAAEPALLRSVVKDDLMPLIDLDYSGRLILGKAGRGVSPEQMSAFSNAMSTVLINRYADGLLQFRSDEQVEVLPMKGKNTEKLTRVRTRIKLENGGFAPVDYAFRKTDRGWKVFDVTVEGISYVITFRNQISPRVEADGIDTVTEEIMAGNIRIDD